MSELTAEEIAWEFAGVFDELDAEQINEMLAKNVPIETLSFFTEYAEQFAKNEGVEGATAKRLPNLMLVGYLLRTLEARLLPGEEDPESH